MRITESTLFRTPETMAEIHEYINTSYNTETKAGVYMVLAMYNNWLSQQRNIVTDKDVRHEHD